MSPHAWLVCLVLLALGCCIGGIYLTRVRKRTCKMLLAAKGAPRARPAISAMGFVDAPHPAAGASASKGRELCAFDAAVATPAAILETPSARAATPAGARLTRREREVARLAAAGLPNVAIAHHLAISPGTVTSHIKNIYRKLDVHSRLELANALRERGELF